MNRNLAERRLDFSFHPGAAAFLEYCLLLDLETRGDRILHIGAVLGERAFERKGRLNVRDALLALDAFAAGADSVLGHNLLGHDLPCLRRVNPSLRLLQKPVIDTLFLSPLAFPENPYHRLVKGYKLVRESMNDPVSDACLAASVFNDQWNAFAALAESGHGDLLSFYRFCFSGSEDAAAEVQRPLEVATPGGRAPSMHPDPLPRSGEERRLETDFAKADPLNRLLFPGTGDAPRSVSGSAKGAEAASNPYEGLAAVFAALGADRIDGERALGGLESSVADRVCRHALDRLAQEALASSEDRASLAYILAWLRVAGANSVLPPWVRHRFPTVGERLRLLRDVPCADSACSHCRNVHDPAGQLTRFFGFESFRERPASEDGGSLQEAIAAHGMKDLPLLAILPTGGGKSICYQLPALARYYRRGLLTIVISPLQALMKDQVDNLAARTGTPYAAALYGLLTPPERGDVLQRIRLGDVAILYVAPEQFRNASFRKAISQREIGAWVFDEAHCLSRWGHDFRPDYLYAGRFIRELAAEQESSIPPVACFTATAKREVKREILDYFRKELQQELTVFEAGVERENLHFEVRMATEAQKHAIIHEILSERLSENLSGSAIVYSSTRRGAVDISQHLADQGHSVEAFHGGLNPGRKRAVQEAFISGAIRVVSATNAFGMGIDKEDVRLVIHADIPGSLESYLQEAGRAGRDLGDAECVLLYNEKDIETQFRFGAMSRLSQKDIAQILRGVRKACKDPKGNVCLTAGELIRDEEVEVSFDLEDIQAQNKVRTAIAWLERTKFLERNENQNRSFQGKPLVSSIEEAKKKIARLNLSLEQQSRWVRVLQEMMNAGPDEILNADQLAEAAGFPAAEPSGQREEGRIEAPSDQVIRILNSMAESGLIEKGLILTAFIRHKVKNHSLELLKRVSALEKKMLTILRETEPDAFELGWLDLSLRKLNQRLKDAGFESNPEALRAILKSLSLDGKGLAGAQGSLQYRHLDMERYRLKLLRDWDAVAATAERRNAVAAAILNAIIGLVPPDAPPSAELLVSFATEDLTGAVREHLFLSQTVKDPLAAVDRGLLFLHEQKIVILQQGLSVLRQAMNIQVFPETRKRRYTKGDYEPLAAYYEERVFQVHVMNEYARLGAKKISEALELVLAYFTLDETEFMRRYFSHRREVIRRATGEESYRKIVEDLDNPAQIEAVAADEDANMLILAGPGSGKTRVVVHRCAYLIRVLRAAPESILVVCFNHHAAVALRKRLADLLGEDARGVTVQTYHGMAMRLTGVSFAELAQRGEEVAFDDLLPEAIRLLKGETELPGIQGDALRDRLLSSFRHILVDEYQDIDEEQYELISALAGRTEKDPECRLSILAVGDDDQNIYAFRGANVRFIRRFQEDYDAKVRYLVENYRSSQHIISAANVLIRHNRDRMKVDRPIRRNARRAKDPPGGAWGSLDPLAGGRVQVIEVQDVEEQAGALYEELLRVRGLTEDFRWSDFAVLSRTRERLAPIRALLEHHGIPVSWTLNRDKSPPLYKIREIADFLDVLKEYRDEILPASQLEELLSGISGDEDTPWRRLLREILEDWKEETTDAPAQVSGAIDALYERLVERRREQRIGEGVLLSTIHGAKGLEFPHVFILDGGWSAGKGIREREEERRIFYVGMTRAKETLALLRAGRGANPYLAELAGDFLVRRRIDEISSVPEELKGIQYEVLGMKDIHLGYAGHFPEGASIHGALSRLRAGSVLQAAARGADVELRSREGNCVGMLSAACARQWIDRLPDIREIRVLGVLRRERRDEGETFAERCRVEKWEIPWVEIIHVREPRG